MNAPQSTTERIAPATFEDEEPMYPDEDELDDEADWDDDGSWIEDPDMGAR